MRLKLLIVEANLIVERPNYAIGCTRLRMIARFCKMRIETGLIRRRCAQRGGHAPADP